MGSTHEEQRVDFRVGRSIRDKVMPHELSVVIVSKFRQKQNHAVFSAWKGHAKHNKQLRIAKESARKTRSDSAAKKED